MEVTFAQRFSVFSFDVYGLFLGTIHVSDDCIIVTFKYFSKQMVKRSTLACFRMYIGNLDFELLLFDQGCMCLRVALTSKTSHLVFGPGCEFLRRS